MKVLPPPKPDRSRARHGWAGGIFGKFQAASLGARRPGTFSNSPKTKKFSPKLTEKRVGATL
jgi:hypothetical protein